MSVTITDNRLSILGQEKQKGSIFLRLMADVIVNVSRPNTPKAKGNLSSDIIRQVLGLHGTITWKKVYAQYQERGMRKDGTRKVKHYTTPGTGAHFAENAVNDAVVKTIATAQKAGLT